MVVVFLLLLLLLLFNHATTLCQPWHKVGGNQMWSVVYVDHFPAHCRVESILKHWNNTQLLIVHDIEHAQNYLKLSRFNWPYIEDTDLMPYTRMYQGGFNGAETAFQ